MVDGINTSEGPDIHHEIEEVTEARQQLNQAAFEPDVILEKTGDFKQAEDLEVAFKKVVPDMEEAADMSDTDRPSGAEINKNDTTIAGDQYGDDSDSDIMDSVQVTDAPLITLDHPFKDLPTSVQRMVYNWSKLCDSEVNFALALGYGSIYNHSDDPNLRYSANPENQTMIFTAVRDIKHGEQLTVSYNQVVVGAKPR